MQAANVVPLKRFYVYELRSKSGRTFYVGKGSGTRGVTHLTRSHNSLVRQSIDGSDDGLTIEIVSWHESAQAAEECEKNLIKKYPAGQLFNFTHTDRKPKRKASRSGRMAVEANRIEARVPLRMDMELTSVAKSTGESKATIIRQAVRKWLDARRENGLSARG